MSDTSIELTDDLKQFISREVTAGRFRSPREVIEAGLLLLEERESRLAALRAKIAEVERADIGHRAPEPRR